MKEPRTKKNDASVGDFLTAIDDPEKQKDARSLLRLMQRATGEEPKMWGANIVGFGQYHYRYASGREGDWTITGFSPRAQSLTVYLMAGFQNLQPLLRKLGKHSTGKSCLYIRRLSEVDPAVLEAIIRRGVDEARAVDWTKAADHSDREHGRPGATGRRHRQFHPEWPLRMHGAPQEPPHQRTAQSAYGSADHSNGVPPWRRRPRESGDGDGLDHGFDFERAQVG